MRSSIVRLAGLVFMVGLIGCGGSGVRGGTVDGERRMTESKDEPRDMSLVLDLLEAAADAARKDTRPQLALWVVVDMAKRVQAREFAAAVLAEMETFPIAGENVGKFAIANAELGSRARVLELDRRAAEELPRLELPDGALSAEGRALHYCDLAIALELVGEHERAAARMRTVGPHRAACLPEMVNRLRRAGKVQTAAPYAKELIAIGEALPSHAHIAVARWQLASCDRAGALKTLNAAERTALEGEDVELREVAAIYAEADVRAEALRVARLADDLWAPHRLAYDPDSDDELARVCTGSMVNETRSSI